MLAKFLGLFRNRPDHPNLVLAWLRANLTAIKILTICDTQFSLPNGSRGIKESSLSLIKLHERLLVGDIERINAKYIQKLHEHRGGNICLHYGAGLFTLQLQATLRLHYGYIAAVFLNCGCITCNSVQQNFEVLTPR
jgi:hypothetical protein